MNEKSRLTVSGRRMLRCRSRRRPFDPWKKYKEIVRSDRREKAPRSKEPNIKENRRGTRFDRKSSHPVKCRNPRANDYLSVLKDNLVIMKWTNVNTCSNSRHLFASFSIYITKRRPSAKFFYSSIHLFLY